MKHWYFLFFAVFVSCSDERESIKPSRKEMVEAVYSSVLVEPINAYKVNASITGYLDEVAFREGDEVMIGEMLFIISNKPLQLNQQNAELNYQLIRDSYEGEANLIAEMKLELQSAKLKMLNDSVNYARVKNLYEDKALSKFELDNASLAYEISRNNYASMKKRIARKEKELKNQIAQSRNNADVSSLRTEEYVIKSNITGKVFQIFKEKGEFVSMQEPLAVIGDKDKFKLKMLIDEVDISKVSLGQKVLVTLEAFKNSVYEAKISRIAPKMDERTQTFKVEAEFTKLPKKLYMGLTGEGNIIIHEKNSALVIPREFLQAGNKVETDQGLVQIKTGLSNWSYIEVLEGIDENTIIYKPE
ncbi:MAG: efflux RND transporter periplasmic adaptor subunit [Flavobacteriia bacterium]|jgi:HlyD family secretion protein